jgi:hypothetical protein
VVPLQSLHRYLHTGQGLQKGSSATMARRRRRRQSRFVSLVCTDRQTDRQTRALPLLCRRVLRVSRFLCTATTQPPVHTTLDASLAVPPCHLGNKAPLLQTSQPRWQICLHQESRSHVHTYVITSLKILLRQKIQITKSGNPIGLEKKI